MPLVSVPVHRIPEELLREIFLEAAREQACRLDELFWLPSSGDGNLPISAWLQWPRPSLPPHNVAQVCRVWRVVALRLSHLWCDVFVAVRTEQRSDRQALHLQSILDRSASAPLRVRLQCVARSTTIPPMRAALSVVFAQAHRLQSLHVGVPFAAPLSPLQLPRLSHLSLRTQHAIDYDAIVALDREDDAALLWLSRANLPRLVHVEYDGATIFPPTMLDRVTLPWGQITILDLRLRWASWQNVAHLLAVTAQVQILRVNKDRSGLGNHYRPLSRAVIVLSSLRTAVMVMEPSDIINLLGSIKAPRLTRLDLCASSSSRKPYARGPADSALAQAFANVASASSTLTCVAIIDLDLPYDTLRSLLNALASLEQLTLRYRREVAYGGQGPCPDASNLLQEWATSPVSPQLRRLSLMSHSWDHAPAGTLLQLVRSRCETEQASRLGVSVLAKLTITRRHCRKHSQMDGQDEASIAALNLPLVVVRWRDRDHDADYPDLWLPTQACRICHPLSLYAPRSRSPPRM